MFLERIVEEVAAGEGGGVGGAGVATKVGRGTPTGGVVGGELVCRADADEGESAAIGSFRPGVFVIVGEFTGAVERIVAEGKEIPVAVGEGEGAGNGSVGGTVAIAKESTDFVAGAAEVDADARAVVAGGVGGGEAFGGGGRADEGAVVVAKGVCDKGGGAGFVESVVGDQVRLGRKEEEKKREDGEK